MSATGQDASATPLTALSLASFTLALLNYNVSMLQRPIQSCRPVGRHLSCHPPALSKPVSPGAWLCPHNPLHLQRVCDSLENPAGNAPGPGIPHPPHRVAHHNGNDIPSLLACSWLLLFLPWRRVWGRVGLPPSPAPPLPSPPYHLKGPILPLLSRASLCS